MSVEIRLPNETNRTVVMGSTGSGKSIAGMWHVSRQNFDQMPWTLHNPKGDEFIEQLIDEKLVTVVDFHKKPPKKPGLYVINPIPFDDDDDAAVEKYMINMFHDGYHGFYSDEGTMINKKSRAYKAFMTQGRQKRIPVITCTQRPVDLQRVVFSEASFFQVFAMNDERDTLTAQAFIGKEGRRLVNQGLPAYHSVWFDVGGGAGKGATSVFSPVPSPDAILETFRTRCGKRQQRKTL